MKKADVQKTEDDKKPAKTGDATLPIGWALAGVVAVLAAVETSLQRRKRRNDKIKIEKTLSINRRDVRKHVPLSCVSSESYKKKRKRRVLYKK
ncbi:MAG: hypothetical protein ACLTKE_12200 [Coprococcus sp.]